MKIALLVLYFASAALGNVLGQSGISRGSVCLKTCYTAQGRAYCCSSAGSYRRPFGTGISTLQQPFTTSVGSIQESYQPLASGGFVQNTGLSAGAYHQPSAITTDAYHQQQVLTTGTYNDQAVVSSSSGLQASQEGNYQQTSVGSGTLQPSTSGTIGSRRQSSTTTNNSTLNTGFSRQPATTIGSGLLQQDATLAGGAIQQPVSTLTGGIGSFQQPNIQTSNSFGLPLGSNLGSYQQSQLLSSPIAEENYYGTTTLGGGTFQRPVNYRQPLTSQANYNQQLTTGSVSYQRPVSNVRGSYGTGAYQRPLGISAGTYQRTNNQLF